ncbi:MAG TPA: serine/threonine-protein kinase, partial [Ktedonobacteraceae bacterium]
MVMPFCPEGSFADWLKQRRDRGLLPPQDVVQLVRQAADALQYAHDRGIIHRDVKPANFLIRSNSDNPNCPDLLLADFGVARITAAATRTSQSVRGTPVYMSPEQWSGAPVPATDQYALAVMAFELLTGRAPFQGNTNQVMYQHLMAPAQPPSAFNPALPSSVDAVILRALAKDPSERYLTISEFARALQQALFPDYLSQRTLFTAPPLAAPAPSIQHDNKSMDHAEWNASPLAAPMPSTQPTFSTRDYPSTNSPSTPMSVPTLNINKTQVISDKPASSFRARTFVLIGLVVLIILAGTGLSVALLHQNGNNTAGTPTATTNGTNNTKATATASTTNANATATASANGITSGTTNTPSTLPQTQNPYPPHTGVLILDDPLHDNSKGYQWDTTSIAGSGSCGFNNNMYHVIENSPLGGITSCNPEANVPALTNFTFQVQMTLVQGDEGGITFRGNQSNFYLFAISGDGSYHLDLVNDNSSVSLPTTLKQASSSYIKGSGSSNLLAVVAVGNTISLYVNNTLLAKVTDSTYSSGQIGLASSENSNATEVAYSNAKVWKI